MARLATELSARLCSGGICTRWMTLRGFTISSSVPPPPSFPNAIPTRARAAVEFVQAPRQPSDTAWRRYDAGHGARVCRASGVGVMDDLLPNSFLVGNEFPHHPIP